jgi:hypothetical protein
VIETVEPVDTWSSANQQFLVRALGRVRQALERHMGTADPHTDGGSAPVAGLTPAPALDRVCQVFGLSSFERDILLLCAGVELDSTFAALCGAAQGDPARTAPTFGLALAALPGAHWSALTPAGPLRHWRLIEVGSGAAITQSPLRIDERVLHFLAGIHYSDERLAGVVEDVGSDHDALPASQLQVAERLCAIWSAGPGSGSLPVVQLTGDAVTALAVAASASAALGLDQRVVAADALPTSPQELDALLRIWQREAALIGSALIVDCHNADEADRPRTFALRRFVERVRGAVVVLASERRSDLGAGSIALDVRRPTSAEQRAVWQRHVGHVAVNGTLDALVAQFDLPSASIGAVAAKFAAGASDASAAAVDTAGTGQDERAADLLWDAARLQSRPRLESLAQRIDPIASWPDIVLPAQQLRILREIAVHVRNRSTVYERWGFAARYARGLGITALFAGPSGTGKTMAAEVLANELRLDLYHIDLSQVVSKYIGETEKNLRNLFDAAEGGGAVLLFDEADALFGKRSEVKDSHDRYSNIEVSYLLQRMEAYRGLAILTTNMKDALDPAFLRRIRFVVQFPFPGIDERSEIWRRVFPAATPTSGLAVDRLARLNLSGGSIRNIAMNAAFLAADEGGAVRMAHLATAARSEFLKLEKPLSDAEVGTWA